MAHHHHHKRDLINKDDAERLKLPVHAPPASVSATASSMPSSLALLPPVVSASAFFPPPSCSAPNNNGAPLVDPEPLSAAAVPSRCSSCRKRLGLAGFRCRCGALFCGVHRYSDRHACSFDYKTQAREAIARDNPGYKAAKLVKI